MRLTIESHYEHLKQIVEFEGNVEEYHQAFGEDANPSGVRKEITTALEKHIEKMRKQLSGELDLSEYRKGKNNED